MHVTLIFLFQVSQTLSKWIITIFPFFKTWLYPEFEDKVICIFRSKLVSRNNKSSACLSVSHTIYGFPFFHLGILVYIYVLLQERRKRTQPLLLHCLLLHLQLSTSYKTLFLANDGCICKYRTCSNQLQNYSSIKSLTNSPITQVMPPDVQLTPWSIGGLHLSCCSDKTPFFQHTTAVRCSV